jgi:CDP-4-dehydro-6-deoxyglucose reductase
MSHRVTWQETGLSFETAADEAVLGAARRCDVPLAFDCQSGGCGTCRVKIVPMGLTEEEAEAGYALLCQARACSDLVVSAEPLGLASPPQRLLAMVTAVQPLGPHVTHLSLELPVEEGFNFHPGQYMNVHLEDGTHRSFSMASCPAHGQVDFHVRRIPGGRFTDEAVAALVPGDALEVELPLGRFRLHPEDYRPLVMLATGTGLAPIKSMLESLMGDDDCPPVSLYWGVRTEDELYLDADIRNWGERLYEFSYHPVLSRAGEGWNGRRGYVQDAALADIEDVAECAFYLCGSPDMIASAKSALIARGADPAFIYSDSFLFQPR